MYLNIVLDPTYLEVETGTLISCPHLPMCSLEVFLLPHHGARGRWLVQAPLHSGAQSKRRYLI